MCFFGKIATYPTSHPKKNLLQKSRKTVLSPQKSNENTTNRHKAKQPIFGKIAVFSFEK